MTKNVTFTLNKKQTLLKLHSWKCTESRVVLGDRFRVQHSITIHTSLKKVGVEIYTGLKVIVLKSSLSRSSM